MIHKLQGGCFVTRLFSGDSERFGPLSRCRLVGRDLGSQAISLYCWHLEPGRSPRLRTPDCDEVMYVLDGLGRLRTKDTDEPLEPGTGFYLPPATGFELACSETLTLLSSRCPEPPPTELANEGGDGPASNARVGLARFDHAETVPTGDRWYRVLVSEAQGSRNVTQFVGCIPPGRAPDHSHEYEEVIVVLEGQGTMWAGDTSAPVAAGSCVFLPRGQVHCMENTGTDSLKLLGMFYPAGSPGSRSDEGDTA